MSPGRRLRAFARAPAARKLLAAEAAWELLRARALTLRPARVYFAALGTLADGETQPEERLTAEDLAAEIGRAVDTVARCLPFRALCLEQAIAMRRLLRRRGIPATVCLGIARDGADRARPGDGRAAHAWVSVGTQVVSGERMRENFAIVALFA